MAADDDGEGHNDAPHGIRDLPLHGDHGKRQDDHASSDEERAHECYSEARENLGNLQEEIGPFDFFLGGTPLDVVRDQMGENSLA